MTEVKKRRNSTQRRVLLEELQKLSTHPTAAELYEIVRGRLPSISLGTVYRNLELLSRMGVIQKLEFGGAEARFDGNAVGHCHIHCVQCGRVGDLHGLAGKLPLDVPKEKDGFTIISHRLVFYGLCNQCKAKAEDKQFNELGDQKC